MQISGMSMATVGAGALAWAALMFVVGGEQAAVKPQVSVTSGGAALGLSGVFP